MNHIKPIRELMPALADYLCNPPPSIKLPSWDAFNQCVGGFRANEFSILCGSTGSGKTSLLANWSTELLKTKTKHFVMSVETGPMDYLARVASVFANEDLNTGDPIDPKTITRLAAQNMNELFSDYIEFTPYDNRIPLQQLIDDLSWAVSQECKIAFIDNLNFFMEITTDQNQIYEMDKVTHELIMFCKRNPIHIVLVMHPKKTFSTRVLSEFDIKGSSTAVQEANNIFLFNRPDPDAVSSGEQVSTDRELLIAKLRRRGKYTGKTILIDGNKPKYEEAGYVNAVPRSTSTNFKKTPQTRSK